MRMGTTAPIRDFGDWIDHAPDVWPMGGF